MSARGMFYSKDFEFTDEFEKEFAREELIYNITTDLLVIMDDEHISKRELADRMGKTKSYITQILNGSRNMTLGTFSDICFALGFKPEIKLPVADLSVEFEQPILSEEPPLIAKAEAWKTTAPNTVHYLNIKRKDPVEFVRASPGWAVQ